LLQRIRRIVGANDRKVSAWPLWVVIIGVLSVVCLTKAKASAETKPAEVASQLAIAVQNGDTVTLQKLLDGGIDLTEDKSNYVYWAVSYDQPKILEMLLDHDAATNLIGPNNESPLNLARRVHPDLVPILEAGMARNRPAHITRLTAALNSFHIDLPALSDVPLGEVVSMLFSDWYKEDTASNPEPYVRTVIPLFAPLVKVTLPPLKNVSIMEALQDITSAAHCKFHVDEDAVYISPPSYGTVLTVRTFLVPPGFFQPKPGTTVDVKQELISLGVEFPAGAGATYLPGTSKLIVRDTPDELDKIQTEIEMAPKVLGPETTDAVFPSPAATVASPAGKASQKPVSQIEVEVKVAEIPEDGYEANKAAFDAGLEKSSVSVISLIENLKGSSFVSTPSVTTRPGKKATIEIVREFPFPSSWEAPHGTTSITPSSPTSYIPPTPKEFVTKDLGISAEITPSLDEDNGKIILDGELSVTDFEGFTESNLVGTGTPSFTTRETHFLEALDDHELKGIWIPGVYYEGQTTSSTLVGTTLGSAKSGTKRLILFLSARLVR
jgi:hypothetical protein